MKGKTKMGYNPALRVIMPLDFEGIGMSLINSMMRGHETSDGGSCFGLRVALELGDDILYEIGLVSNVPHLNVAIFSTQPPFQLAAISQRQIVSNLGVGNYIWEPDRIDPVEYPPASNSQRVFLNNVRPKPKWIDSSVRQAVREYRDVLQTYLDAKKHQTESPEVNNLSQ